MIGIIGAMEIEISGILKAMTVFETRKIGFATFWQGKIGKTEVVLAECGIGKVFSAACTQAMILSYAPDYILNIGVGGALTSELAVGDAAIGNFTVQYDMDTSAIGDPLGLISGIEKIYLPCDDAQNQALISVLEALGVHHKVGVIATADRFVDDDRNRAVCRGFNALVEDMEGAAVGQVCYVHRIPFGVLRTISNGTENAGAVYADSAQTAATVLAQIVLQFCLKK